MKLSQIPIVIRQQLKINKLQLEVDSLKDVIKTDLFNKLMSKITEPLENERLKKENIKLRKQVKTLKEIIKGNE